ncbi:MAG: phenylalanine--tRNA ligase subunit beta [Dichotomicrobium sp.]
MKFTLSWLKDHLQTEADLDEIRRTLDLIGLEVESIVDPAEHLAAFSVARVVEAKQHPNADKLKVCQVDTGSETVQVVCGAPNARTGMLGVFAPPGAYIPGSDMTLSKATIRGVESSGMLCSERELQISDEHEGIIELPDKLAAQVGKPYAAAMGLDDPVIDIAITPNRPDCLGVRGVARDLAAAGLGKLKRADRGYEGEGAFDCPVEIRLEFDAKTADACPVFTGRTIHGVKNGPSPEWMQKRLRAIGLRPINALVDVTNYISYDRARPLHVYDADKLRGAIRARLGKEGETFLALDEAEYEVDETMCVIADKRGVLGLGGVIGGMDTGCTEATTNVFIEAAYFDPVRTAKTGRKTGIQSDARYRFERGIDPTSHTLGANLATAMILKFCGGEPSRLNQAGKTPPTDKAITFDPREVRRLTGVDLKPAQITRTLTRLGFKVEGREPSLEVRAPGWRPDVEGSADLVEEVIRIAGVDQVPAVPLPRTSGVARPVLTRGQRRVSRARRMLAARGMAEAVNWAFIPKAQAELFGGGQPELALANPISTDMSDMRPSLLPGLLTAARNNANRGFRDAALFEVGNIYRGDTPEDQVMAAAGVRTGTARQQGAGRHWDGAAAQVSWIDAKADAFALLEALGLSTATVQLSREVPGWLHPGQSAVIRLGPKTTLGVFGAVHPSAADALDVALPAVAFEIYLDALPASRRKGTQRKPLESSDLQAVTRDFAFVVNEDVAARDVLNAAQGADKKLIAGASVFDIFRDAEEIGKGNKSLAIEVTLQPKVRTLTDDDIDAVSKRIVSAVGKATGGRIRS